MNYHIPGIIMAFREGLEAFLIITIILEFLTRTENKSLKKYVYTGFGISLLFSLLLGFLLYSLEESSVISKLWESLASLLAVTLIISFMVWMSKSGHQLKNTIEKQAYLKLSSWGIFILTTTLIAREGVEIVMFSFAGNYPLNSIIIGLGLALVLAVFVYYSLLKINFKIIFNITLIYLIIQAGYLLGYGLHELLEVLEELSYISESSPFMVKAFDLSTGPLNHKNGIFGLPLNIVFGWYSKPQWLQFISQYVITIYLGIIFWKHNKK